MSAAVDSPAGYPESPMDPDDMVYPCKGCGEILEEGKAFELAGQRWHIDCFRCNTCGTLLDSDANLLLLGDGSLICNNCTYSCNACGNKIEDLAILTGDQAFCSDCFRCRNCKRKIENLRYARTSQGIFCMACHESLMARRRKKSKTPKPTAKEKALPSLPQGIDSPPEFASESSTPQPSSPRLTSQNYKRDASPLSQEVRRDGPTLPASTYGDSPRTANDIDDDVEGFLPMVLDPTPISTPPVAGSIPRKPVSRPSDPSPTGQKENQPPQDYFYNPARLSSKPPPRDALREDHETGSSSERERERAPKASPHILSQDKGRLRKRDISAGGTPTSANSSPAPGVLPERSQHRPGAQSAGAADAAVSEQEESKSKELPSGAQGSPSIAPMISSALRDDKVPGSPISLKSTSSGPNPFDDLKRRDAANAAATPIPARSAERGLPLRGDSLAATGNSKVAESTTSSTTASSSLASPTHGREISLSSGLSSFTDAQSSLSRDSKSTKAATETPGKRDSVNAIPPRSASRPGAPGTAATGEEFVAPRAAPPAPISVERHRRDASISTMQSEEPRRSLDQPLSPSLLGPGFLKFDGGFSLDDEMGRIMRGDKRESTDEKSSSVLRRVSNAVKHGRSFSERSVTHAVGKSSPLNSSFDVSSPTATATPNISSPSNSADGVDILKASLKRAQSTIAGLEAEKMALEERLNGSSEIKAMNTELREKRSTMAVLDTQREMVGRELEVLTQHLSKAKDSSQPLDLALLKSNILKDFAESLQKLKDTMSGQIEDLVHKRNELTDEIGNLIQMKDKGFQEYENLSNKNTQLVHHNNELLRSIQGVYQDNRHANGTATAGANGLGIYHSSAKSDLSSSADARTLNLSHTDSLPQYDGDVDSAQLLTAPQVVNIRKAAKPNKFNWRRGGEKMAKNVTKGIKGAFVTDSNNKPGIGGQPYSIGLPYGATHEQAGGGAPNFGNISKPTAVQTPDENGNKAGFGFFGQKNGASKVGNGLGHLKNNSVSNLAASDGSVLFGSELSARCEFEGRIVPHIVTKCIAQVEARGMDVEGVYRKSGGAGQVKTVQQGFEKDNDHDISDPDLDIHAVTSALKQYFRKLPTPLITYDAYDALLEAGQVADREKQIAALRAAIHGDLLPEAHRNVLHFLLQHLANVMRHEPQNLMTPLNLAVVFAPTIMRPESIEREMTDMQAQRVAIQALLELQDLIFPEN